MRVLGGRHVAFGLLRSFTFSFISFKVLRFFQNRLYKIVEEVVSYKYCIYCLLEFSVVLELQKKV